MLRIDLREEKYLVEKQYKVTYYNRLLKIT